MSTHPNPTTTAAHAGPSSAGSGGTRSTIVGGALALGSAAVAAMLLWNPWPARDELSYDAIAPLRDDTWLGITIDAVGFATFAITVGLVVCMLARTRGARWASVGAVLAGLGGVLYAMGAFAFAAFSWYATETEALSAEAGTALMKFAEDEPGHILVVQMAGFLLITLGVIALAVALLRAGTVPRWLPVAVLVLTVAQFTPVPGRVLDLVQVALMAVFVVLAVLFVKAQGART